MSVTATVTMADPAHRPSPRAKTLWTIHAAALWVIPFAAQIVWAVVDAHSPERSTTSWPHVLVFAVTAVVALAHVVVVPRWRYAVHRWEISDTAVYTRTGWFDQERRIAPITRVQTVDTERGPVERLLGLATVTVTTASAAGSVTIAALDLAVADATVARVTDIAALHRGDAT